MSEREPPGGGAAPQQLADTGAGTANPAVAELEAAFAKNGFVTTGVLPPEQALVLQLFRAQGTQNLQMAQQIAELNKVEAIVPRRH